LHGGRARRAYRVPDNVQQEQQIGLPGGVAAAGQLVVGVKPGVVGVAGLRVTHPGMQEDDIGDTVPGAGIMDGARLRFSLGGNRAVSEKKKQIQSDQNECGSRKLMAEHCSCLLNKKEQMTERERRRGQ